MKKTENFYIKFMNLCLIMALLFMSIPAYSIHATGTDESTPIDTNVKPSFIIDGDAIYGPFSGNNLQNLKITVKNNSSHIARDIFADLSSIQNNEDKFDLLLPQGAVLHDRENSVYGNGKATFDFKFQLNPKAVSKPYKLKLKLRFKNSFGVGFEEEHTLFINVENKYIVPSITVGSYEIESGSASSTEVRKLKINLQNNAKENIRNLTVQLTDLSADGIELYEDSEYKYIGDMAANGSSQISYKIRTVANATGDKILKLKIKYYDKLGVEYEKDWQLNIPTSQSSNALKNIKAEFTKKMYSINPGETIDLELKLANTSEKQIKDLKLHFTMDGDLKFLTPYIDLIDTMEALETKTFKLTILAPRNAGQNINPISAILTDNKTKNETILAISGIKVAGEGMSETSKPKIIIDKYEYGGDAVLAGQEFDFTVEFLNTSGNSAVKNVKVQFDSEDGIFTPVNATNSFFFKEIPASGKGIKTIRLKSKADAKVKLYSINFNLEYENASGKAYDEKGNLFTSKEIATVNVKQELRLETKEINVPMEANIGSNLNIETEFYNMGKSPIYNLVVKLEGDFEKRDATSFVGTFEPGKSEFFSGTIVPSTEGEHKGEVIFEFEDEIGEKYTVKKEFTIFASEGQIDPGILMPGAEDIPPMGIDENGNPITPDGAQEQSIVQMITSPLGIISIVVVIGIIAAVIIQRNRKKKAMLEEIDDED